MDHSDIRMAVIEQAKLKLEIMQCIEKLHRLILGLKDEQIEKEQKTHCSTVNLERYMTNSSYHIQEFIDLSHVEFQLIEQVAEIARDYAVKHGGAELIKLLISDSKITERGDNENWRGKTSDGPLHSSTIKAKIRRNTTLISSALDGYKATRKLQVDGFLNEEEIQDIKSEKYKTSELLMALFCKSDSAWVLGFMQMLKEEDSALYKMLVNTDLTLSELDHHVLIMRIEQADNLNIKAKGVKEVVRKNWMIITREVAKDPDNAMLNQFGHRFLEEEEVEFISNLSDKEERMKTALIYLLGREDHGWALEFMPFLAERIGIQAVNGTGE